MVYLTTDAGKHASGLGIDKLSMNKLYRTARQLNKFQKELEYNGAQYDEPDGDYEQDEDYDELE